VAVPPTGAVAGPTLVSAKSARGTSCVDVLALLSSMFGSGVGLVTIAVLTVVLPGCAV
jgi:hypothetical protein